MTNIEYHPITVEQRVVPAVFAPAVARSLQTLYASHKSLYLRGGMALQLAMQEKGLDVSILARIRQELPNASVQTQFLDVNNVWRQPIFAHVEALYTSVQPDIDLAVTQDGFDLLESDWHNIAAGLSAEVFVPAQNPNIKILKASAPTSNHVQPQKLEITSMVAGNFRFAGCNTDQVIFSVSRGVSGFDYEQVGKTPQSLELTHVLQEQMLCNNRANFGKIISCISRGIRQAMALQIEIPTSFTEAVEAWAARVMADRSLEIYAPYDTLAHNPSLAEAVHREWLVATALRNHKNIGQPFGELSVYDFFGYELGLDYFTRLKAFCELAAGPVPMQNLHDVQQEYGEGSVFDHGISSSLLQHSANQ